MTQKKLYDESAIIRENELFFCSDLLYLVRTGQSPAPCKNCWWYSCCSQTNLDADLMGCDYANDAIWVHHTEISWYNGQKPRGSWPSRKEDL